MPSSITLTVSHLPTSTSFFLSALQPLDYGYRGRSNNTIGFGSTTNPSAPPDFWITQEIPGVPAGAAHVAFKAPSKMAVQNFFTAALKAGGKFHGEPAVRDSGGYYSAAIIDFDGNSIEAVFRPEFSDDKENDGRSTISFKTIAKDASDVKSQISQAPPSEVNLAVPVETTPPTPKTSADMIGSLVTEARSAAGVVRTLVQSVSGTPAPQSQPSEGGDKNAIFGTLLGVAAGAALHYAFTKEKDSSGRPSAIARSFTEPALPAPYHSDAPHDGLQYLALEDNDKASTIRPAGSTAMFRRNSNGGQTVYSTAFGMGPNAGSAESQASRRHPSSPKMIEAPPAAPSFLDPASPSRLSQSPSAHHTRAAVSTTSLTHASSRLSINHQEYERSIARPAPSTATTTKTTKSRDRPSCLRTISDSQVQRHRSPLSTYPPQSAAATSRAPPPPASRVRPSPLSEANLAIATAQTIPLPASCTTVSLHSRNRELEAYPDPDAATKTHSHSHRRKSRKRSSEVAGSRAGGGSTSTRKSKMEMEVRPEDSVSQVSSVRSVSTVRPGGGSRR